MLGAHVLHALHGVHAVLSQCLTWPVLILNTIRIHVSKLVNWHLSKLIIFLLINQLNEVEATSYKLHTEYFPNMLYNDIVYSVMILLLVKSFKLKI